LLMGNICAQNNYSVGKIEFKGNRAISASQLKKNLNLKSKNLIQKIAFWTKSQDFNEFYLEDDVQQITALYQRAGFLKVDVKAYKDIDRKKEKINLLYKIKENEPVLINDIKLKIDAKDQERIDPVKQLLETGRTDWTLQENSIFRDLNILALNKYFHELLLNNGYPSPEIKQEILLTEAENKADVIYNISAGTFCSFGTVNIIGNERTPSQVISRQISFNGEQFSQTQLQETQRRIQQLGIFQFVTMKSMLDEIENNTIPIEILVKELPEWSVKFGIGYGLEDRLRASLDLLKLNFLGGARRANLYLKHSFLEPYNVSLKITQPAFLGPYGSLAFKPYLKKEHEPAYDLETFGTSLTFQNIINPRLNGSISYRFERSFIELSDETEADILNEYYNKSALSQGLSFNNSTPAFYPETGFSASYVVTLSGLKLNSKYHYLQGLVDLRKYQRILAELVLAGKIKIGSMKPIWGDTITPLEERYYAGGSLSLRGWGRNDVSPKNENNKSIGGNSYLELSLEARQKIFKILYLVLFLDAGNVWMDFDRHNLNDLKYSPGIGLRLRTPIGPIRLDAAQPVWDSKKSIQLHLSIGQAF